MGFGRTLRGEHTDAERLARLRTCGGCKRAHDGSAGGHGKHAGTCENRALSNGS
jgi:hypothetical protein